MAERVLLIAPKLSLDLLGAPYLNIKTKETGPFIEAALKELGYIVHYFDYRRLALEYGPARMNELLIKRTEKLAPEFVLTLKGERIAAATFKELRDRLPATRFGLWYFDVHLELWTALLQAIMQQHCFFAITKEWESWFKLNFDYHGTVWMPEAFAGRKFYPRKDQVTLSPYERQLYTHEVAFAGTDNNEFRAKVLADLAQKKFKIGIYGNQFQGYWKKYGIEDYWMGKRYGWEIANVYGDGLAKLAQATPCILGFTNNQHYDFECCFSQRVYQVLGVGGFMLEQHSKGIEVVLGPGKHLETWKTADDLADKIHYYTDHPEEREAIAAAGCAEVMAKHQFIHRLPKMLDHLRRAI